jgi:hypothetical protein
MAALIPDRGVVDPFHRDDLSRPAGRAWRILRIASLGRRGHFSENQCLSEFEIVKTPRADQ